MALERTTIQGHEGDIYCRPTTWLDIAKFMLLNYVLHALTVIPEPGGGFILALFSSVTAVVFPLFGTDKAIARIAGARRSKDPLERAKRAGALCMVVPRDSGLGHPVVPAIISVHGSYPPVSADQFSTSIDLPVLTGVKEKKGPQPPAPYELVTVPSYFVTRPIPPQHLNEPQRVMELAYNTAVLKSLAALVQICYGSFELYVASGNQISRLGYAAYSLTIIPYVLMSALNLIGTLCCPSYPSLYIVYYRGTDGYRPPVPDSACSAPGGSGGGSTGRHNGDAESVQVIRPLTADQRERKAAEVSPREGWMEAVESRIVGAVGCAYALSPSSRKQYEREHKHIHLIQTVLTTIAGTLLFVLPYILTYILTGYRPNQSTLAERIIIVSSLTVSQVLYITIAFMHHSSPRLGEPEYKYGWYPCSVYGHWPSGSYGPAQISAWLNMDNGKRLLVAVGIAVAVAPSVAGFVMVGRMILGDEVCVKL